MSSDDMHPRAVVMYRKIIDRAAQLLVSTQHKENLKNEAREKLISELTSFAPEQYVSCTTEVHVKMSSTTTS